MYIVNW